MHTRDTEIDTSKIYYVMLHRCILGKIVYEHYNNITYIIIISLRKNVVMSSTRAPKNTQMYDVHDAFSGVLLGKGVRGHSPSPRFTK